MRPTVIVGAGITGCVIGYELAKRRHKVIIIEKESKVGGLARTFHYGDFAFDIGPHRFYAQEHEISTFIQNILKDDFKILYRNTGVYFLDKYYTWPLRPTVFFNLPLKITLSSAYELFLMLFARQKKEKEKNFENYILKNYGPTLYNVFFKNYTQKFLDLPPQETHADWAKEAMKRTVIDESLGSRNLVDLVKLTLKFKPAQTQFIYPTKGIDVFCTRLVEEIERHDQEVWVNNVITDINHSGHSIEEISVNGRKITPKSVIWTGSLNSICSLLEMPCNELNYLSVLLFNIELKRPLKNNYQWCYYGNSEIFSRVSTPRVFSRDMAPQGKSGLCVEVTSREGDQRWRHPERLIAQVKKDLVKVGLIEELRDIGNIHIEKVSDAYPVYTLNYPKQLQRIKEGLAHFENLILAGRTGLFWYNNMDHSIRNGLEVAKNIIKEKDESLVFRK